MNKKEELKSIIDSLNNFMGKIDSVDEPKPTTDFTTGNNAFKHLQQPKYPEGILSFKTCYDQIVSFKNQVGNYQNWCNGHLGKERENIVPSTIHSVKNKDGEIFTVNDFTQYGNITGFTLGVEDVYASFNTALTSQCPVDLLTKVEKPQPSWKDQIVAFRNKKEDIKYVRSDNGWFDCHTFPPYVSKYIDYLISRDDVFEIFTVKNKAGVEFSVGDEVSVIGGGFNRGKIDSFQVIELGIYANFRHQFNIDMLTKAEPKKVSDHIRRFAEMEPELEPLPEKPKPLFKTEDGFDVYEGDGYFAVRNSDFHICEYAALFAKYLVDEGYYTRFKHKSNAEKFVAENKKSISYKELEDYVVLTTPFLKLPEQVALRNILNHFKPDQKS